MTVLSFSALLVLGEREYRVVIRVESDGGIKRDTFLSLEALNEPGAARLEKLLQVVVGQFLVQHTTEHQQPASVMVALGHFGTDNDFPRLAFGTGEDLARHRLQT